MEAGLKRRQAKEKEEMDGLAIENEELSSSAVMDTGTVWQERNTTTIEVV